MAAVQTTAGAIDSSELGRTLIHEHFRGRDEAVAFQWPHVMDDEEEHRLALEAAEAVKGHGVRTVVEPTAMLLGRDVRRSRRLAAESGLQVVACTGIYTYDHLPQFLLNRDADYIANLFVHDVERVLRAVAQASLKTGRPIMAHSQPATRRGLEIMDVFDDEGIDPRKVQIAHTGDTDDLDYIEELLARGPWIGMDRYGLDIFLPTDKRNATVIELCKRGHANRMTLSQDACATMDWYPPELKPQLAPEWDFTFLWRGVLPALSDGGVSDDEIDTMMRENPRAWLTA